MSVFLHTCMYVYHVNAGAHGSQKRALDFLKLGVSKGCGSLCGFWEANSGPLQE